METERAHLGMFEIDDLVQLLTGIGEVQGRQSNRLAIYRQGFTFVQSCPYIPIRVSWLDLRYNLRNSQT